MKAEITAKQARSINYQMTLAKLPVVKEIAEMQLEGSPINVDLVAQLAQDGLDHVDGHRTVGLVISPYVKRRSVDSTFYTIINMYRTIETLLGLPPTNQFDLAADPMFTVFTAKPGTEPYTAIPNRVPLDEMNPPLKALRGRMLELARASQKMDLDEPDVAPEGLLNQAIWHSVKGPDVPYPALKRNMR